MLLETNEFYTEFHCSTSYQRSGISCRLTARCLLSKVSALLK
jgi:hypothetical protein